MFETDSFKQQLDSTISEEAGRVGLSHYQRAVVDMLFDFAKANETELIQRERNRPSPRGIAEALQSARTLVQEAAKYVQLEEGTGRRTLTQDAAMAAYKAKFCNVWPFCK